MLVLGSVFKTDGTAFCVVRRVRFSCASAMLLRNVELKEINYCSICLGSFIPWDYVKNTDIIKRELGWESDELEGVPTALNTSCEKIECFMQGTRDYIKYLKRGYSRITQISAFHLRNGRLTQEEAAAYRNLEGRKPPSLKIFLEYMGLTEEEFRQIVKPTTIPPYEHDFSRDDWANETWDFDQWYREDNRLPLISNDIGNRHYRLWDGKH